MLDRLPPFLGGGEMIETVTMARSTYAKAPHKFEAGTPPIVEAVGLGAAVDYLSHIGMDAVHSHEQAITAYALEGLATVPGVTVLGPTDASCAAGRSPSSSKACTRTTWPRCSTRAASRSGRGHHCAKPAHARFGVQASSRMSSYLYTTPAEIDAFIEGLEYTRSYFRLGDHVMTTELDALYQEIILDHYKNPHHKGLRDPYEAEVHHVNPTCGDEVTLRVHLDDGVVQDVSYDALGCSISQASASVMTDLVIGKPVDEAMAHPRGVPRPDAGQGPGGARRGGAGGRHRLRRRREVPRPREVRPAVVDGLEGRDRPGHRTPRREPCLRPTTGHATTDLPEVPEASASGGGGTTTIDDVTEALKDVVDPELGINVVDLGLVYGVHLDDDTNAVIDMTLTSAACPLTDVIQDQTNQALEGLVNDVLINWVWMPPWGPDKITDDGREQLRALGFNV